MKNPPGPAAYLNKIETRVPTNDVHQAFVDYACGQLASDPRQAALFRRLSDLGEIDHRYSYLAPSKDDSKGILDEDGVYVKGAFPSTAVRMKLFEEQAPKLAFEAVEPLLLGEDRASITHLIVTCCTGFSAPGIDLQVIEHFGLSPNVERTLVGFMGCYAAMNALKLARHIVRSEPSSRVIVLNLELCSLHLKETSDLEQILSFFLFADGCAASLITSEPKGIALDRFYAVLAPNTKELITWNIGDSGFEMMLSGKVPKAIRTALCDELENVLDGAKVEEIDLWAIHPGGRSILDSVQQTLDLAPGALWASREVLKKYGNMSSATVMFVLKALLEKSTADQRGCAMAFGPGLMAETMLFHKAS